MITRPCFFKADLIKITILRDIRNETIETPMEVW